MITNKINIRIYVKEFSSDLELTSLLAEWSNANCNKFEKGKSCQRDNRQCRLRYNTIRVFYIHPSYHRLQKDNILVI